MKVLLLQLDGTGPNLALMRIAAHYRQGSHDVELRRAFSVEKLVRYPWDDFDKVYASLIFERSRPIAEAVLRLWPDAKIGGTGWDLTTTLEDIGIQTKGPVDYSDYPGFMDSIGFTQRGCRLSCKFCVVPKKEGRPVHWDTIAGIWRGEPFPRNILLLDNDFFGNPAWRERIAEIREGRFKVSFNQGINARMLTDEAAEAIASVDYRSGDFKTKRIYTAWDNLKDEEVLISGVNRLIRHGVKPDHVMVYVLIGYDHKTREALPTVTDADFIRIAKLRELGCRPYPMPYVRNGPLVGFQRWVVGAYDKRIPWVDFERAKYDPRRLGWIVGEPRLF